MSDIYDIRPQHDTLQRVVVWRDPNEDEEYSMTYDVSNSSILEENLSYSSDLKHVQEDQNRTLEAEVSQVFYVFKGRDVNVDSYSVLLGNDGSTPTGLYHAMLAYDYSPDDTDLTVLGIAYDYCVGFTVFDAVDMGYEVTVMDQLTAPVFPDDVPALIESMIDLGVTIDYSSEWMDDVMDSDDNDDDDDDDNALVTALIILALIVVVIVVTIGLYWINDRKKGKSESTAGDSLAGKQETEQRVVTRSTA